MVTYRPDWPPVRQKSSWTCSICTTAWCLQSIGVDVSAADLQDVMAPSLVDESVGLHDGSGGQLARFIHAQTGREVTNHVGITWEWLQEHAGQGPIGLGSGSLYHWVAIRKVNPDGTIALANPADGYRGLYDTMTEEQFHQWAPWSAVFIEMAPEAPTEPVQPEEDDMAVIAELQRVAREEVIANIEKALAVPRLPKAAREALESGALPAAQTIARGGAPEE